MHSISIFPGLEYRARIKDRRHAVLFKVNCCRWLVLPEARETSDFALRFAYCVVNSSGFSAHCETLDRQVGLVRDKLPGEECLADCNWPDCRKHLLTCLIKGARGMIDTVGAPHAQNQARMLFSHPPSLFRCFTIMGGQTRARRPRRSRVKRLYKPLSLALLAEPAAYRYRWLNYFKALRMFCLTEDDAVMFGQHVDDFVNLFKVRSVPGCLC